MSHDYQPGPGDRITMGGTFDALLSLAHALSLSFTVFLRTDFGREGIGRAGLGAAILILLYGQFAECQAMWVFFLAWLVAVICQRIRQFNNWRMGTAIHTYYNGFPWISTRLFPRLSERNARGMDGWLCVIAACGIVFYDKPLALFFVAGGVAILLVEAIIVETTRRKLQQMRDAEMEQRYLTDLYKQGRF